MNRFLLLTISTLLVSAEVPGLRAVDRTDEDNQEQSVASPLSLEILLECMVCSHTHWIPADIDPLIIKQMILLDANQYFENCLNTQTCTAKTLADNLTQFSKKFSALDDKDFPHEELGILFALHLEKNKISLSTLLDEEQNTVLHCLMKKGKYTRKPLGIIFYAAGTNLHKLALMQNNNNETILHFAAAHCSSYILKMILTEPKIDIQELVKVQTADGFTALTQAVYWNNAENVLTLLSCPRINIQELAMVHDIHKKTILHIAAYFNSVGAIQALQHYLGINMQQLAIMQSDDGNTALHDAAFRGNLEPVIALCKISALNGQQFIMMRNNDGKTALDYAIEFSFNEITKLLLDKSGVSLREFLLNQNNSSTIIPLSLLEYIKKEEILLPLLNLISYLKAHPEATKRAAFIALGISFELWSFFFPLI